MAYDLKITGGRIVDGSGRAAFSADIGVTDGRIVEIGRLTGAARREIAADGAIVTPGFIDPHTHYDGQATWDSDLHPSSRHGVTTAVFGNCGVGFAPLEPGRQDDLIALMSGVEDIPGPVLHEGMAWNWRSFAEYLAALEARPHTVNLAAQVTHGPVRLFVMGERALRYEAATPEDLSRMRDIVHGALAAGAVGFSTGRISGHRMSDGGPTPDCDADHAEPIALAGALRGLPHRVLHVATDFDIDLGGAAFEAEFALLEAMARAAGRPLSTNLLDRLGDPEHWKRIIRGAERANAAGLPIRMQTATRGIGLVMGLSLTLQPFSGHPSYQAIAHLPIAAQVRQMRDPVFRARVLAERPVSLAGDGSSLPRFWDDFFVNLEGHSARMFAITDTPDSEPAPASSVLNRARAAGVTPLEMLYDIVTAEDDGRSLLYFPFYNFTPGDLSAVREMMMHPLSFIGAGDAGAHVGLICDNAYPTFALAFWTRDRVAGPRIGLERMVHTMTGAVADHYDFADRGRIAPGKIADLNVIDLDRVRLGRLRVAHDLPAGGRRLMQDSEGYLATLVAGVPIAEKDALTGAYPGKLLRGAPPG